MDDNTTLAVLSALNFILDELHSLRVAEYVLGGLLLTVAVVLLCAINSICCLGERVSDLEEHYDP